MGESIYYVDSGDTGMGGVIRRVTSAGAETLDFTAAEAMQTITFAVSADETRIAWTHSGYETTGVVSQLWIASLDGSDARLVAESDAADSLEEYFSLEAVRWEDGDLIYAWQVTGIGGYIDVQVSGKRWLASLNYGEYHPEKIGDPLHDEINRRFLVKYLSRFRGGWEAFAAVLVENDRPREPVFAGASPYAFILGMQASI